MWTTRWPARLVGAIALTAAVAAALALGVPTAAQQASAGNARTDTSRQPWVKAVPKADCGRSDRREPGLQGQTSIADRFNGASSKAYNCNLELVGQFQGEGASWQMASFEQCAYYDTANGQGQAHKGVVAVDVSNPRRPVASAYLDERPMWDAWESLKVNPVRKLLAAVQADRGAGEQAGFAVYDVSECRRPVLKGNVDLGVPVKGHAGNFTPDGRTYYGTQARTSTYPIDVTDPSRPKLLGVWNGEGQLGLPHDVSLDATGNRLYTANLGGPGRPGTAAVPNGLVISDASDFQARRPDPKAKVISSLFWKDGANAQQTERFQVNGRPYIVFTDEGGSGGLGEGGKAACAQNLPPFGFARIIDISDEKNPVIASKLMLEVHDPANCAAVTTDTGFASVVGYSSHYCTPNNGDNARYLACSYFEAGIRVFDIRDPYAPREIAYYKSPATGTATLPGSAQPNYIKGPRTVDWAASNVRWNRYGDELHLWFTTTDNGFQVVRFTNQLSSLGRVGPQSR